MVVNITLILVFLLLFFHTLKKPEEWMKKIDRKEHKLYLFYPLANWIFIKTGLEKLLMGNKSKADAIKAIHIRCKQEYYAKLFWCKRLAQVIIVLTSFQILCLAGWFISTDKSVLVDGTYIIKPDYGKGDSKVNLEVLMEDEETGTFNSQEVRIDVKERIYTSEEVEELFDKASNYLKQDVLGNNKALDLITQDLNFRSQIPGTSIKVDWIPEDYRLVKADGSVWNEGIKTDGVNTYITAVLNYYDHTKEYIISLRILPKQLREEERLQKELQQELEKSVEESAYEERLRLPELLGSYRLHWQGEEKSDYVALFFLGILIAGLVWIWGDRELNKQMQHRKEQMLMDYPEIINKFTLLINAGMTIKQAWFKIAEDYLKKCDYKDAVKHYAYEEMLATMNELKLGLSEHTAYEQYGRRTGIITYIKFSSLISQNLKKGTRGFTELLMYEAKEAFEERKEIAKRLGEEAGTKLLLPMMIMLIIILLIIMVPAFLSFQI